MIAKALNPRSKAFMHTQSCSGGVHTHSKAFTHTQLHSGVVQYSLKGIHVHSITFRGCSHSVKGVHTLSISVQGVFNCDQYSLKGGQPSKAQWIYAKKMWSSQRPYRFAVNFSWTLFNHLVHINCADSPKEEWVNMVSNIIRLEFLGSAN